AQPFTQQDVRRHELEAAHDHLADHGQQVDTDQWRLLLFHDLYPVLDKLDVVQRDEQEPVVLALFLLAIDEVRGPINGPAMNLVELALDNLPAGIAAGVRQGFQPEVFLYVVGKQINGYMRVALQKQLEILMALLFVLEDLVRLQLAQPPYSGSQVRCSGA